MKNIKLNNKITDKAFQRICSILDIKQQDAIWVVDKEGLVDLYEKVIEKNNHNELTAKQWFDLYNNEMGSSPMKMLIKPGGIQQLIKHVQ